MLGSSDMPSTCTPLSLCLHCIQAAGAVVKLHRAMAHGDTIAARAASSSSTTFSRRGCKHDANTCSHWHIAKYPGGCVDTTNVSATFSDQQASFQDRTDVAAGGRRGLGQSLSCNKR